MAEKTQIRLSKLVLKAYRDFYNWKGKYLVCKGARGSGKSYAASIKIMMYMMQHPLANALCIRQVAETLRDSCWATFKQTAYMMGVHKYWKFTKSPLEITYIPTGQKILFRGMDDPLKITSINVEKGFITHVLVEEAYQLPDESAFEVVEFSIRGVFPGPESPDYDPGLYRQFIFIFNPYAATTWLKPRFFDNPSPDTLAMTTTYKDNVDPETGESNLGQDVVEKYEKLYITNPKRARVICDGDWGVAEGLVYDGCWEEKEFDPLEILKYDSDTRPMYGLDFGFAVSFTAFVAALVNVNTHEVWVFDEIYERGLVNRDIAKRIVEKGYGKERIIADSAEPKSLFDLQQGIIEEVPPINPGDPNQYITWALPNITGIHKTTIEFGISLVQGFKIYVHPKCKNVLYELQNYAWAKDKDGKYTGKPEKENDHAMDAIRYMLTTASLTGSGSVYEAKGGAPSLNGSYKPSFDMPGYQLTAASVEMNVQHRNPVVAAVHEDDPSPNIAIPSESCGMRVFGPRKRNY